MATGSRPIAIPGFPFSKQILDFTGELNLKTLPESLVVGLTLAHKASYEGKVAAEVTLAIESYLTLEDIALTIHGHPTLSEMIMDACEVGLGLSIHR